MDYNYLERLEYIYSILRKDNLSIYDRISKIIIYEYDIYREIFKNFFTLSEYLDIITTDIPPSIVEIRKIERLVECIVYISKYKLSKNGLREKYPEFSTLLEKYILWDINEQSSILEIYNCLESSDILKLKKKIKKGTYGNYKKFFEYLSNIPNLTYNQFKVEKKKFLSVYGKEKSKKYLNRLLNFEMTTKFKIDSYIFNRIKKLRERNIISRSGLDINELIDLKENIAPVYWSRIPSILWGGLKSEYKKISKIKNKKRKKDRIDVFIFRYNKYSTRINNLKLWHSG